MTKSGFCGIKHSLQFNFLLFNASQKEMGEKRDQGRLHVAEGGRKVCFLESGSFSVLHYGLLFQVLAFYSINLHSAARFHSAVSLLGCLWVSFCGQTRWESCSFSSITELPSSQSCASSSCRERCSTMPAPRESPRTLVVVLRRSLKNQREKWNTAS